MVKNVRWPVFLETGNIGLRPLKRQDHRQWLEVRERNKLWLSPWDATSPVEGSAPRDFAQMCRQLNVSARRGEALPFALTYRRSVREKAVLIGQLTVSSIVYGAFRSCTMGYWIDSAYAGKNIMPTAVALAADFCFEELELHRVEINIRPENGPSLRLVDKLGFRDEGLRPAYLHIDGQWRDHRSFALTREEVPRGVLLPFMEKNSSNTPCE